MVPYPDENIMFWNVNDEEQLLYMLLPLRLEILQAAVKEWNIIPQEFFDNH